MVGLDNFVVSRVFQSVCSIKLQKNQAKNVVKNMNTQQGINITIMTIFASGQEREIQQFDWFLNGLELAVPNREQREF